MQKRKAIVFQEMIQRYVDALPYCENKSILDAGCRDGYGSHLVSMIGKDITLVDNSPTFINKIAQNQYKYLCKVDFEELDLEKTFPDKEFDVVLAFEIIEHLENPEFFVENVLKHLTSGGYLIFSVPHLMENPVHKVLFDEDKIKKLITKYFIMEDFVINNTTHKSYFGIAKKIV